MKDHVVVVTGASAGVGRATVREFARAGANVALIARGREGLEAAAQEVLDLGRRCLVVPADVAQAEEMQAAANRIEKELGPIDVWVNNAMASVFAEFVDIAPDDFERVTRVTYLGQVNGTRAALDKMLPRDRGTIIQIGSALAYRGIPLQSAYCGAKHAVQGFTESLRCELLSRKSRVTVTMVQLPALNTPQFHWVKTSFRRHPQPVPPIFQPELAARAIVWAARHKGRELYVGGPTVATIVADKLAPGLLDRYLARTGLDSQKAEWPTEPERPNNLWVPVEGDHGPHGEFDTVAKDRSIQWWVNKRRGILAAWGVATGVLAWAFTRGR
jgi:NAD(P)-dependent dehydrogenase (short-subunit alcohol dehydrogenase family)